MLFTNRTFFSARMSSPTGSSGSTGSGNRRKRAALEKQTGERPPSASSHELSLPPSPTAQYYQPAAVSRRSRLRPSSSTSSSDLLLPPSPTSPVGKPVRSRRSRVRLEEKAGSAGHAIRQLGAAISQLISNETTSLVLEGCRIGDRGAVQLSQGLKQSNDVRRVKLGGCDITCAGLRSLSDAFQARKPPPLTGLPLVHNIRRIELVSSKKIWHVLMSAFWSIEVTHNTMSRPTAQYLLSAEILVF